MRILVVGAGALGGLVGAQLTESGEDVTFIEIDEKRAELLNQKGLTISEMDGQERTVAIKVVTGIAGLDPVDLVFVSVKGYQTENATRGVMPVIGPETKVLSMQNGIGNTEIMAELIGQEKILSGITYHSIQHTGPTSLRFKPGIKPIQIAPYNGIIEPGIKDLENVFRKAGLNTDIVENINHVIWQKLLHNAVVNPVSAISGLNCNQLLADEDMQQLMRALCMEIVEVMKAHGVPIIEPEDPYRPVINSQKALGENRPSMWQDLSRGLRTEIDSINGAIVKEAKKHGLDSPLNWMLVRLVHSAERNPINEETAHG
jgi:2-dehydropantoate 2-reductase